MTQIELYDRVQIKEKLSSGDETYTIVTRTKDREGNTMFALEDEDGFLLEELYYPSQLLKLEEQD